MIKFSWTLAIAAAFVAYMAHSMWVIYTIFSPTPCVSTQHNFCIQPYLLKNQSLELQVFTSHKQEHNLAARDRTLIWRYDNFSVKATVEKTFNVSIPLKTRRNGTLFLHVFVHPKGSDLLGQYTSHAVTKITTYAYPKAEFINLLGETKPTDKQARPATDKMISHWRYKVSINVMDELIAFERTAIPGEVFRYLRVSPDGNYLPMVFIDEMAFRMRDLLPINTSAEQLPLTITYSPISVGKLRMWTNFLESFKMLQNLGFTEKDTDEIKGIFADTNFYFLLLTFAVAAFHLLFDFLAFKNEITYWKRRKTMVGLSTRAVIWRCISTIIIFFYLMDEKTSLLILIPAGIAGVIEIWKVKKALKVSVSWSNGVIPKFKFEPHSSEEKETEAYDSQAMKYLSYLLYPLCLAGAVYSLLYVQHKSWYSWFLQSLVNGIYALGFLFMLPQLFVNYKLKSVAHLPWRAFMYKAFNTFIDDVFAFIITMPTAHRLACFRDDVVFIIYLYQRWLYPVDKKRVNEFGESFEEETKKTK
ncbi:cleft lip and palate transmembrane protein 1-like protein [Gigantopelta aegis]|uniref:cleft lip and palate transmembrane protein 1-like protein n=1 Tax=Gigantopelta aegis TaxID=1735272 RepID=UPI001B8883D2|nr:cleft lip and palate transmembrane protein 1-like protein [Gigantopelta aegis]